MASPMQQRMLHRHVKRALIPFPTLGPTPTGVTAVVPNNPVPTPGNPTVIKQPPGQQTSSSTASTTSQSTGTSSSTSGSSSASNSSGTSSSATSSSSSTTTSATSSSTTSTLSSTSTSSTSSPALPTLPPSPIGPSFTSTATIFAPGASAAAASQTSVATSTPTDSGMSTAGIVGIAAGAIVGVAVLAGIMMYFLRRCQRREDNARFDSDIFRRQSVVLPDENSSIYGASNRDGRPRPPTMIERHYENLSAPPFNAQGYNQQRGEPSVYNQEYNQASYSIGQVIPPPAPLPVRINPFYNPMGQSPVGSPVSVAPYGSAYDDQGQLVRQPSHGSVLTRANPTGAGMDAGGPAENEYMDLNRSSVTPFQAAQYAAISRQLNVPPPVPELPVDELPGYSNSPPVETREKTGRPSQSPFSDPTDGNHGTLNEKELVIDDQENDSDIFVPPHIMSPNAAKMRIPSTPPVLPEIQLHQRAFSPVDSYQFPASPSPFNTSFSIHGSPSIASSMEYPAFPVSAHQSISSTPGSLSYPSHPVAKPSFGGGSIPPKVTQSRPRPETVYDDEDAYAGI